MPQRDQIARIPSPTVRRLSLYLRELEQSAARGHETLSSKQLGAALGLTDAQVRKDLAYFGQFGHPGVGYRTCELIDQLKRILGTDRVWNACVIGAGNIGRALMAYQRFVHKGFHLVAVFDADAEKVGCIIEGHRVRPMDDLRKLVTEREIRLAIIAVPPEGAQEVAERLIDAGVVGIMNFAPARLDVHDAVSVIDVDLSATLEQLAFQATLGLTGSLDAATDG